MIRIWTDGPIRESEPEIILNVAGHPVLHGLKVQASVFNGWDGYALEFFGREVIDPHRDAPRWRIHTDDGPLVLEVSQAAVWHPPTPMRAIVRWVQDVPTFRGIEVLHEDWNEEDLKAAGQAYRLLLNSTHEQKRPSGTGYYGPDDGDAFRFDVTHIVALVLASDRPRVSVRSVARTMGIDRETLAGYLTQFDVNLKTIEVRLKSGTLTPPNPAKTE